MDARQFFDKVAMMREAQKAYFKTRRRSDLERSKALEREIDAEIERVNKRLNLERPKPPTSPSLFGEEELGSEAPAARYNNDLHLH